MTASGEGMALDFLRRHELASEFLMRFAANAAAPRLMHRLRWTSQLRPRGLAVWLTAQMLAVAGFSGLLRGWLLPWWERQAQENERVRADLRQRLGREPSDEEVLDARVPGVRMERKTTPG